MKGRIVVLSVSIGSASAFNKHTSLFKSLASTVGSASNSGEQISLYRSLTMTISSASTFAEHTSVVRSLSISLGLSSSFTERSSFFRSLSDSLGFAGSQFEGHSLALNASLGSVSNSAQQMSLVRSLTGSLFLGSGLGRSSSAFRSLSDSWTTNSLAPGHKSSYSKSIENKIGDGNGLSGHYDCSQNLIVSCGSVSVSFAFLAIAIGAVVFAVFALNEGRKSSRSLEQPKPHKVVVDKEGWETKASDAKGSKQSKASNNEERKKSQMIGFLDHEAGDSL